MKDKLQKIKGSLELINDLSPNFRIQSHAQAGVALLDTLIAELDSEELLQRIASVIHDKRYANVFTNGDYNSGVRRYKECKEEAKAAINAIKGTE